MPALAWFVRLRDPVLTTAVTSLRRLLTQAGMADVGESMSADAVIVWSDEPLPEPLVRTVTSGPAAVVLAGPTLDAADRDGVLAEAAGLVLDGAAPAHDVRVRPGRCGAGSLADLVPDHGHAGQAHLGVHTHITDRVLRVGKARDDVQPLLVANLGLATHPLATWRPRASGGGVMAWTPGSTPEAVTQPGAVRLFLLSLRTVLGMSAPAPVRVGLLGYGAIGHEHSRAVRHVPGLDLAAVCDTSPQRRAAAQQHAPDVRLHESADTLLTDDDIDLVVVSTPPSTHAHWAARALEAGKHVVVEKPFAIRTEEADAILASAAAQGLLALVYQNRRFDPDHQAIRRAVHAGRLGELFHLEAFVGGYGHPCNLWHSDADVSGGAFYDWGAHVLDQILDLFGDEIEHVTAAEHKRLWLDVTNADHSRVTIRFAGGAEATFVYSDLAAALKPRWYVLGTRGAIVGHWRTERIVARNDIGTLAEDVLAPADSPPLLDLHEADGSVTRMATPRLAAYPFHAELADRLRFGLPTSVTAAQSRKVLAVMEAASASARDGGRPTVPR